LNRIASVYVFRLIAVTAVIAIHTQPFHSGSLGNAAVWDLGVLINQSARFAVPFFFVTSGYFWGTKIRQGISPSPVSLSTAKRIFQIFAFWSIVYALPYDLSSVAEYGILGPIKAAYWNLLFLIKHPLILLMQGTKSHLWFLIALLCSLGISNCFVVKKSYKALFLVSVALYSIGLLAKAYADTPFGIRLEFNTRNGPFFSTIFFVSGYFLSQFKPGPGWFLKGVALLAFGWTIHFSELYILGKLYGTNPSQDYLVGTYFMGIGTAVASLSNNAVFSNETLRDIGKFTLGIYAIHLIFVDILSPISKLISSPFWEIGYICFVLMFSVASVTALSKSEVTRRFVQ
jgi:surface polysaccharide O-acyltransferase-like enzyme